MKAIRRTTTLLGTIILSLALVLGLLPIVQGTPEHARAYGVEDLYLTDDDADGILMFTDDVETVMSLEIAMEEHASDKIRGDDSEYGDDLVDAHGSALIALPEAESTTELEQTLEATDLAIEDATVLSNETMMISLQPAAGQDINEAYQDALAIAQELPEVTWVQPNYTYELLEAVEDESQTLAKSDLLELQGTLSGQTEAADDADNPEGSEDTTPTPEPPVNDPVAQVRDSSKSPNQYWLYNTGIYEAWETAKSNKSITVAVLDSGVMTTHEDLQGNLLTDLAWDAKKDAPLDTANKYSGDSVGHGTRVAGIISSVANNGVGMAGASYNAYVLPIKVTSDTGDGTTTKDLTAAYEYLFQHLNQIPNLRVINMSLGGYGERHNDDALHGVIKKARDTYRIVTVCAGGNGDNSRPYTQEIYPGDFDECVSVTALTKDGDNLAFSDYNAYKDISAPGQSIFSPVVNAEATSFYGSASGTSLAAPIVSAAFALLFVADPDATVDDACEALYATAQPIYGKDLKYDRSESSGSHGALQVDDAMNFLLNHRGFNDVSFEDWFFDEAYFVKHCGLMNGYGTTGYFGPNKDVLREEAAQVVYRMKQASGTTVPDANFDDVNPDEWYVGAINWINNTGIMTGYSDSGLFGIGDPLTREQLAKILVLAANISDGDLDKADSRPFDSLKNSEYTSDWAIPYMRWMTDKGIIKGVNGTDLAPQNTVTRAEIATMVTRMIKAGYQLLSSSDIVIEK